MQLLLLLLLCLALLLLLPDQQVGRRLGGGQRLSTCNSRSNRGPCQLVCVLHGRSQAGCCCLLMSATGAARSCSSSSYNWMPQLLHCPPVVIACCEAAGAVWSPLHTLDEICVGTSSRRTCSACSICSLTPNVVPVGCIGSSEPISTCKRLPSARYCLWRWSKPVGPVPPGLLLLLLRLWLHCLHGSH